KRAKKKRKRKDGEPFHKVALRKTRNASVLIRQGVYAGVVKICRKTIAVPVSAIRAIRNWFTPLRIVISLLSLILVFGGYYAYQQHSQKKALKTLREALVQGDEFLKERQWVDATEQYHLAAQAVEQLGRSDLLAWQVLQKDRELQAIEGLCGLSLEDIIQAASERGKTTLDWQTEFKTVIHQRWLVMESWVVVDAGQDDSQVILSSSMSIGEKKVNFIWPANLYRSLIQSDPLHVLCAGQIGAVEPAQDPRFDWVVKIIPDSAFLWCFEETTAPLGLELDSPWFPEDSLRLVLKRQHDLLAGQRKGEKQ
ncbi:MAG: hypothetical protein JKY95_14725, partial [Planctomycetaceae bacterium]|nr:hypothetical protein [Planctomycetaceae bacterium]